MTHTELCVENLSKQELEDINGGGFIVTLLAIGAGAAAVVAIYEAGKATGEFIAEIMK